jgi:hypothetical protein
LPTGSLACARPHAWFFGICWPHAWLPALPSLEVAGPGSRFSPRFILLRAIVRYASAAKARHEASQPVPRFRSVLPMAVWRPAIGCDRLREYRRRRPNRIGYRSPNGECHSAGHSRVVRRALQVATDETTVLSWHLGGRVGRQRTAEECGPMQCQLSQFVRPPHGALTGSVEKPSAVAWACLPF